MMKNNYQKYLETQSKNLIDWENIANQSLKEKTIDNLKKNFDGKNESALRLLVLGGSQGALSINTVIPEFFSNNGANEDVHLLHQTQSRVNPLHIQGLYPFCPQRLLLPINPSGEIP